MFNFLWQILSKNNSPVKNCLGKKKQSFKVRLEEEETKYV